jgi:hypothetical protein
MGQSLYEFQPPFSLGLIEFIGPAFRPGPLKVFKVALYRLAHIAAGWDLPFV